MRGGVGGKGNAREPPWNCVLLCVSAHNEPGSSVHAETRRVNALNAPFAIRRRRPPRADLSLLLEVGAVVENLLKSAGSTS